MSMNATDCDFVEKETLFMAYIGLAVCCLVACESLVTIVTILRTSSLQETQYLFIVSLSLMDILLALTYTNINMFYKPSITYHVYGHIVNMISLGVSSASISVIGVHMSIIAIDRYIRIAHPFYYIRTVTKQRIIKLLVCVWIVWILMACTHLNRINNPPLQGCNPSNNYLPPEFIALASTILISVGIVCVCYGKIAWLAISHEKAAIGRRYQNGASRDTTYLRTNNTTIKSIRFFVTMFGVYCFCAVVPFTASGMTYLYRIPSLVFLIVWNMFPFHSFLNFVFFCLMDKRFKRALKTTLSCRGGSRCYRVCTC